MAKKNGLVVGDPVAQAQNRGKTIVGVFVLERSIGRKGFVQTRVPKCAGIGAAQESDPETKGERGHHSGRGD